MKPDSCMKLPLSWLLLAAIWFPPASAGGQTYSVEQARKEGEVILYSTITVGAFDQLSKALKEKYPFINVRHIRLAPRNSWRGSCRNNAPVNSWRMWSTIIYFT